MRRFATILTVCLAVGLGAATAVAQRARPAVPDPSKDKDYDWKKVVAQVPWNPEDVEQLERDKLLVTNATYRQVFTPYISTSVPVFITSDTVLSGYHVLMEESVLRLEWANAVRLPQILDFIWKNLDTVDEDLQGEPELIAAAKARAQTVIAVALRLLDEKSAGLSSRLAAVVDAEVKRVVAAQGMAKPKWLGPADPGFAALDYTRYRPRGFYTRSEALKRYFRAVSWLQSIPFRVEKDEELLAILMLGNKMPDGQFYSVGSGDEQEEEFRTFFGCYRKFVGAGDEFDLLSVAAEKLDGSATALEEIREDLMKEATRYGRRPRINDMVAFVPADPSQQAELAVRIISPARTPDAILFGRTTDRRKFHRPFPQGLEVCAALGSPLARSLLSGGEQKDLLATIDRCKVYFDGASLYAEYLDCLRALVDAPEPDAPAFFGGVPWQTKSCQTALSGWSLLRHTWVLQAKQNVTWLGFSEKPPGFVEPEPEFFARFARLTRTTEEMLRGAGAFESRMGAIAERIRVAIAVCRRRKANELGMEKAREGDLTMEEIYLFDEVESVTWRLAGTQGPNDPKTVAKALRKLDELATQLERGKMPEEQSLVRPFASMAIDLEPHWQRLYDLCRRLETLAHKQLRKVPFSDEENQFLLQYGQKLGGIMLYDGNSYLYPEDDAPRIVDVYTNPEQGKVLLVGTARPRALYVLYPYKGGEVLCRGAVLPYYEFASERRLTDQQWKALLDSKERPEAPAWIEPIRASGGAKPQAKGEQ